MAASILSGVSVSARYLGGEKLAPCIARSLGGARDVRQFAVVVSTAVAPPERRQRAIMF